MKICVTGGAGFIGSNFIHYMLETYGASIQLHNVDCLTYAGNLKNLVSIEEKPNYFFHKLSITDKEGITELFKKQQFDWVIHFAAESHVDRSILGASEFVTTNVLGTQVLLDVSKEYKIKRFVHVSTDEVYGSLGSEGAFRESTHIAPNSPYSASKAGSDLLVRAFVKTHRFPAVITRCSNNYGPYQFPEKLIPLMFSNAMENKSLPVYGNGLNVRDWIYVEDHCKAVSLVAEKGRIGEVYNVGGDAEMTNIDIVKTILKKLDKPDSLITYVKDRPGHDFRYAMDFSKINQELGWTPSVTFEEGITKTLAWYLAQGEWLNEVRSGAYQAYYAQQYGSK